MATYRYLLYDLLTNQPTLELPFYGTWFTRLLNKAGNGTASVPLDIDGFDNRDIIDATEPGRNKLYVERNGKIVWSGIIWTRTWQEQAKQFNFTLQTLNSFFYDSLIETSLPFTDTDQRNVMRELINSLQAKPSSDIGLIVPSAFTDNILRTQSFYDYDGWTYGEAIDHMLTYENSFDYDIDPSWGPDDEPIDTLRLDDVLGKPEADDSPVLDYPGNIKNFWYPESAARSAVSVLGFGKGEGASMPRQKYVNPTYLERGYPDLQKPYDNKDTADSADLLSQVRAYAISHKPWIISPTVEVNPEMDIDLDMWAIGDYAKLDITSSRFPGEMRPTSAVRIVGWELNPPSKGVAEEKLKLTIQEVED